MQRLGSQTWQSALSLEALKILVTELKRVATKASCIVIYDTSGREPQKVIHIGNRNRYTPDGQFAFSTHQEQARATNNQSGLVRLLAKCCEMAGLMHDLGKGSEQFQKKLSKGVTLDVGLADPIRHEVISVLMASPLLAALPGMRSVEELEQWCYKNFQPVLDVYKADKANSPAIMSQKIANALQSRSFAFSKWEKKTLVETSINWMILSHHRLPDGRHCDEDGIIPTITYGGEYGSHYFLKVIEDASSIRDDAGDTSDAAKKPKFNEKDFNRNLSLCSSTVSGESVNQPWHDPTWRSQVFKCYQRIARLTAEVEHLLPEHALADDNAWATGLSLLGRTALVYADYIVSAEKKPSGTTRKAGTIYANTIKIDNQNQYADTLVTHLLLVGKRAAQYCSDLFIKTDGMIHSFPSLSGDERKVLLPGLSIRSTDARYRWQDVVRDKFKPMASNTPFFGSVMGKTGAGKTRGNMMLMHALKEDMRFTCAIGLRSLVKQTYAAYQESFIGLTPEHVALLIGESQGQAQVSHDEPSGSGNDLDEDAKLLLGDYILAGDSLCESDLAIMLDSTKQRAMLANPVQVMTVDHIMPGASLGRSSELKLLMHLMGTDIVLDEIDDYPVNSQAALMRMAFISGVFGRSFVLSSATATPIIQKAFFNAWRQGIRHHAKLFQSSESPAEPFAVLVSHVAGNEALRTTLDSFEEDCDAFVEKVITEAENPENIRHRLGIAQVLNIDQCVKDIATDNSLYKNSKSLSRDQHQQLIDTVAQAHEMHGINHQGIKLSSGFIRFNNIRNAQHLARVLNIVEHETLHIVPICYHAAMLYMDRLSVETLLSTLNCRKANGDVTGDLRIFDHPYAKACIEDAKAAKKKEIIFVLCTTNIIEVGRDHDYDWAILEPSSTRSLVQSCGRVWRHRTKSLPADHMNVWMLPRNIRGLLNEENESWQKTTKRLWTNFGIEDENFKGQSIVALRFPLSTWAEKALKQLVIDQTQIPRGRNERAVLSSDALWSRAITGKVVHAGLCLEIPTAAMDSLMPSMELAQQYIHLNGIADQQNKFTLENPAGIHYANLAAHRLTENHPKRRRLRDSNDGYSMLYDSRSQGTIDGYPSQKWRAIDRDGKEQEEILINKCSEPGRLFVPPSLEQIMTDNPDMSSRMLTEIGLRNEQFKEIRQWQYVYGLGLCKCDAAA